MDVLNYNFVVINNLLTFESRGVCHNLIQGVQNIMDTKWVSVDLDFETPLIGVEMGPMKTYIP